MANLEVATTIKDQLGSRALMMLGASGLVGGDDFLQFSIKGSPRGNKLVVTLDPSDTYTVTLWKIRGVRMTEVDSRSGVYFDQLHDVIEKLTGLYTRL